MIKETPQITVKQYVITWTWACMWYMGALLSVVIYLVPKQQMVITILNNINTITKVYQIALWHF